MSARARTRNLGWQYFYGRRYISYYVQPSAQANKTDGGWRHFELASWANMQHAWQFELCQACGFTVHCCSTIDANSPVLWTKQLLQSILFAQVDWTIVNFSNFSPKPDRRGTILQFSGLTIHRTEKISSEQKIILQGKKKIPLSASNNTERAWKPDFIAGLTKHYAVMWNWT